MAIISCKEISHQVTQSISPFVLYNYITIKYWNIHHILELSRNSIPPVLHSDTLRATQKIFYLSYRKYSVLDRDRSVPLHIFANHAHFLPFATASHSLLNNLVSFYIDINTKYMQILVNRGYMEMFSCI